LNGEPRIVPTIRGDGSKWPDPKAALYECLREHRVNGSARINGEWRGITLGRRAPRFSAPADDPHAPIRPSERMVHTLPLTHGRARLMDPRYSDYRLSSSTKTARSPGVSGGTRKRSGWKRPAGWRSRREGRYRAIRYDYRPVPPGWRILHEMCERFLTLPVPTFKPSNGSITISITITITITNYEHEPSTINNQNSLCPLRPPR